MYYLTWKYQQEEEESIMNEFAKKLKAVCRGGLSRLVINTSVKSLVIKSIIYLLTPYAYIFVCGFVFDMLLKWYFMTTFIFISMCVMYLIAFVLIIVSVVNYRGNKKANSRKKSRSRKKPLPKRQQEVEIIEED